MLDSDSLTPSLARSLTHGDFEVGRAEEATSVIVVVATARLGGTHAAEAEEKTLARSPP